MHNHIYSNKLQVFRFPFSGTFYFHCLGHQFVPTTCDLHFSIIRDLNKAVSLCFGQHPCKIKKVHEQLQIYATALSIRTGISSSYSSTIKRRAAVFSVVLYRMIYTPLRSLVCPAFTEIALPSGV